MKSSEVGEGGADPVANNAHPLESLYLWMSAYSLIDRQVSCGFPLLQTESLTRKQRELNRLLTC